MESPFFQSSLEQHGEDALLRDCGTMQQEIATDVRSALETPAFLDFNDFAATFRARMNVPALWEHPYFALIRAEPTIERLRQWAIQAGRIDQVFAEILSNMLHNPVIPSSMHPPIRENLDDELGHGDPEQEHFQLFRHVLHAIGVTEEEYGATPMTRGTEQIIQTLRSASVQADPIPILSLMASEELICPREFPIFLEALRNYASPAELRYFDVHIEADVGHSEDLMRLCYEAANNSQSILAHSLLWQAIDLQNNVVFYDCLMSSNQGT